MECDVAVLGGGPGGYTAAIRAAQLGAKTVCIEKEPELGGTCLRIGCIPTKAWVQTAFAIKEAEETFAKLGVQVGEPTLDFAAANQWKDGVSKQMTSGVAEPLQDERRRVGQGHRPLQGCEDDRGRGRGGRLVPAGDRRHRLVPAAPADRGHRLAALRRLDRPARADRGAEAARRPRRRHHRLRVRLDHAPLRGRGDDHRDAPDPDPAGGRRRRQGARQAVRQARHRPAARLPLRPRRGHRRRAARPVQRRPVRRVRPDARRHRPRPARREPRPRGDRRRARQAHGHRRRRAPPHDACRTSTRSATAPATGSSPTPPSARARSRPRTRWATRPSSTTAASRARSTPTRRSPASA